MTTMPPAALALFYPSDTKHLDKCEASPAWNSVRMPSLMADRSSKGMSWHLYRFHTAEACSCGFRSPTIIFILHPQAGPHTHTGLVEDLPGSSLYACSFYPATIISSQFAENRGNLPPSHFQTPLTIYSCRSIPTLPHLLSHFINPSVSRASKFGISQ